MAALIQSPAKCEVRSVIRYVNAKGERPAEIHKQIVAVYGNVMNRQNVTKWCREFSEGRTDFHDEVQEEVMTCFKGQAADFYDSVIQKLVPRLNKSLDNAGDYVEKKSDVLKNKVICDAPGTHTTDRKINPLPNTDHAHKNIASNFSQTRSTLPDDGSQRIRNMSEFLIVF